MIDQSKLQALKGIIKKPHVNSTCIGCSSCAVIAGDVFRMDDEWLSRVNDGVEYSEDEVNDAIAACPVNAISWQETDAATGCVGYSNGAVEHQDV